VDGPLAALRTGEVVVIDLPSRLLHVEPPAVKLRRRLASIPTPAPRYVSGALAKYAYLVGSASDGAVTSYAARVDSSHRSTASSASPAHD
jgi:dihydroxy-acid dehydratase